MTGRGWLYIKTKPVNILQVFIFILVGFKVYNLFIICYNEYNKLKEDTYGPIRNV